MTIPEEIWVTLDRRLGRLAGEALREHALIAAKGLAEYYRQALGAAGRPTCVRLATRR